MSFFGPSLNADGFAREPAVFWDHLNPVTSFHDCNLLLVQGVIAVTGTLIKGTAEAGRVRLLILSLLKDSER